MANPWAGEVAIVLDGQRHVARLTLGALAELEAGLQAGSLLDLVERFETGRFSTRDDRWRRQGRRRSFWPAPSPCPVRDESADRLAGADAGGFARAGAGARCILAPDAS
jgi:hypothetical protein